MSAPASRVAHYLEQRPHLGGLAEPDAIGGANIDGRPPEATMYLKLDRGRIADAGFQASGCGYLIACCSCLLEMAIGRTLAECRGLSEAQLAQHLSGLPESKQYCASLAVLALRNTLGRLEAPSTQEDAA